MDDGMRRQIDEIDRILEIPPVIQMVRNGVTGASRLQCLCDQERVCTLIYREDEVDIYYTMANKPIAFSSPRGFRVSPLFSRQTTIRRSRLPQPLRDYARYRELALSPEAGDSFGCDGVAYYHTIYANDDITEAYWHNPMKGYPGHDTTFAIVSAYEKLIGGCGRGPSSWGEIWDHLTGSLWFLWW